MISTRKFIRDPRTPQQRHAQHAAEIRPGRGPHAGELYCVQCQKHIQWLSPEHYACLTQQAAQ